MSWLVRFLGVAALLSFPYWFWSRSYQEGLRAVLLWFLGVIGADFIKVRSVEIYAPSEIGVYIAMCVAGTKTPWRHRLRALALGVPILVLLELVALLLMIAAVAFLPRIAPPHLIGRVTDSVVLTVLLMNASLVWLALLGRTELRLWSDQGKAEMKVGRNLICLMMVLATAIG